MKANNNKLHRRSKWGAALLACAAGLALMFGACTRDGIEESNGFVPGAVRNTTLRFSMSAPEADVKTRGVLDAGGLKLETIWLGIFDTKTGEMLGSYADRPRKNDGTRVKVGDGSTWTVDGIDIWYYDNNPEVYIAAVVNFDYVKARNVGETELTDLSTLLGIDESFQQGTDVPVIAKEINWNDLRSISVDTKSVDSAMTKHNSSPVEELTLAMGFFNTSKGVNTTIDRDGNLQSNARVPLTEGGQQFGAVVDLSGSIHLRRLQSDIKVNINFSSRPTYDVIYEVNSLRYKIINKPVEVYLAEHTVDQIGGSLTGKDNYLARTANSADWLELNEDGTGYTSDNDWINIKGSIEDGYSFSYSHFENKHWGVDWKMEPGANFGYNNYGPSIPVLGHYDENYNFIPDEEARTWKEYFDEVLNRYFLNTRDGYQQLAYGVQAMAAHRLREARVSMDDEKPLFKSLVNDKTSFNNNASYILIEADMTWKNAMDGSIAKGKYYYTIHEGYTSHADGSAVPAPNRVTSKNDIYDAVCDFQTIRNTKYTYNLTFSGLRTIEMQAFREDGSMHDDGYTGETSRTRGSVITVKGGGNAYTENDRGDNGGFIYTYYDPTYSYNFEGFIPLYYFFYSGESIEERKMFKCRFYEKRPDGEANYGTCSGKSQFEWPQMTGEMKSLEDLQALPDTDPMKQFYNHLKIHIALEYNESGNRISFESLRAMSLDEFYNGADREILRYYEGPFYYFITVDAYEVDDDIENFDQYRRHFYFLIEESDDDGCSYSELLLGLEQGPYDHRAEFNQFEPFYLQNIRSGASYNDGFSIYSAVQNFSNTEYIRWFTGVAYYDDDDDDWEQAWYNTWHSYMAHEARTYTIYIDGEEKATIDWDSEFRHRNYQYQYDDYLHLSTKYEQYFAWPYNPNELTPGDHEIVIKANVNEELVQPAEIRTTLRIIERPFWKFDNETYPIINTSNYDDYFTYASMTTVFSSALRMNTTGYNSAFTQMAGYYNYGNFAYYSSSSTDNGVFRFSIDQHGKFRVRLSSTSSYTKRLAFAARNKYNGNSYIYYMPTSTNYTHDYYFNTRDIIDNFDNGPVDVAIYADSYNNSYSTYLYVYEIEWIKDENQEPNYDSYINYSAEWKSYNEDSRYHYMHPYRPYAYNRYLYLTPGFVNYFGFTDSNPRAQQYKIGFYDNPNTNSKPVFEQVFDAEDCLTYTDSSGRGYFICPMYLEYGDMESEWWHYIAVTPIADGFAETTYFIDDGNNSNVYAIASTDRYVNWWGSNGSSYNDGNPWYEYNSNYSEYMLENAAGEWSEWYGLVLHGGTASMTLYPDFINFGGNGYPLAANSTPEFGRYLSFTTDHSGDVVLRASSTGTTDRFFRLYRVDNGTPVQVDMSPIGVSKAPFRLSTGPVSELTEFIICPEGGVNLYGIRFVSSDDDDDRISLNSKVVYSNWSTDPTKPIHPGMYDYPNDADDDYYYDDYRVFLLAKHFASPLAFSDDNPRAQSYKLMLFDIEHFNGNNLDNPDYSVDVDPDTYKTYEGDGGEKVFTYPLLLGNDCSLPMGEYALFVQPVGDPAIYKEAKPQFLTLLIYYDWTQRPPIDDDDFDIDEDLKPIAYSPVMPWTMSFLSYANDHYNYGPQDKDFVRDENVEFMGLTLCGSGVEEGKYVAMRRRQEQYTYEDSDGGSHTQTINVFWTTFPGSGYPLVSTNGQDRNVGSGRNIRITTDTQGKILFIARADQATQRNFILYKKQGDSYVEVERKQVIYPLGTKTDDITKPIVFNTGEISEPTEFIICPENSSEIQENIIFVLKGYPAYDFDWENGMPGYQDGDGDDADGYRLLKKMASPATSARSPQQKLLSKINNKTSLRK